MRILHTSDWHLGRIFYGRHLTGEQEYALELLCDIISQEKPDVLVVAGDVFDRAVPPVEAVNLLDETLYRIVFGMKTPVIMVAGNHDSPDRLGFGNRLFKTHGLNVFGLPGREAQAVTLQDRYGEVCFCPIPFAEAPFVRDALGDMEITGQEAALTALVNRAVLHAGPGRRVAIAHAFIAGGQPSESERPLSIGGTSFVPAALFSAFSYTALGHLHRPQQIERVNLRYSGSLMKYSFDEAAHRKSVAMVEMAADGAVTVEAIELKPRLNVRCISGRLDELIKNAGNDPCREDFVKATLTDEGALFDAMGQLRQAYPNALEIERAFVQPDGIVKGISGDYRKYSDFDLFCEFYSQVTGKAIGEDYLTVLKSVLEEVRRGEAAQ